MKTHPRFVLFEREPDDVVLARPVPIDDVDVKEVVTRCAEASCAILEALASLVFIAAQINAFKPDHQF